MIPRGRKLWAILICLTITGLLVGSCTPAAAPTPTSRSAAPTPVSPTSAGPTTTSASPTSSAEQPRYGGILPIGMHYDCPNYNVHTQSSGATLSFIGSSYNKLIQNDPMEPTKQIPDLAEKWEVSPDGLGYTFYLRKGVKFHDGQPFTSADAKFSIERIYNPPKGIVSPYGGLLSAITKVETLDDYTLKITLGRKQASFISMLAMGWMVMAPKHIEEKGLLDKQVVGTGPFILASHLRESLYEVKKNPDYFVKGRPYLDGIRYYVLRDPATRLAAFRTGRVMAVSQTNGFLYSQAKWVEKEMKDVAVVDQIKGANGWMFIMPHDKKPWSDLRVRKAVSLAIDRQRAIDIVEDGYGVIAGALPNGPLSRTTEELLKLPGYRQPKDADIAEAKRLMAEAGYPNGFKTTVLLRFGSVYEPGGLFIKAELAKLGIEASLDVKDTAALFETTDRRGFDSFYHRFAYTVTDPDAHISARFTSTAPENYMDWKDPEVDSLFAEQAQTLDPGKRKELLRQIEDRIFDQVAAVVTHNGGFVSGHWKKVRGFKAGIMTYDNFMYDYVWLAE